MCSIADAANEAEAMACSFPIASEHLSPSVTASSRPSQSVKSSRLRPCSSLSSRALSSIPAALI